MEALALVDASNNRGVPSTALWSLNVMWAGGHCKLCIICQFPEMEKLGGGGDDGGTALPPSALPRHRKGGKYFSTSWQSKLFLMTVEIFSFTNQNARRANTSLPSWVYAGVIELCLFSDCNIFTSAPPSHVSRHWYLDKQEIFTASSPGWWGTSGLRI